MLQNDTLQPSHAPQYPQYSHYIDDPQQLVVLQKLIRQLNIKCTFPNISFEMIKKKAHRESFAFRALCVGVTHTQETRYVLYYLLLISSLFFMLMTFLACVVWVPSFLIFVLYGMIYPIIKLCQFYEDGTLL